MIREINELVGIEGGIDTAVVQGEAPLQPVADLLVPYRSGARGWFKPYEEWVREETGIPSGDDVFPTIDGALEGMATSAPVGRDAAHRLLALTVLSRALKDYSPDGDVAIAVQGALAPLTPDASLTEARSLHLLIHDADRLFPTIESWSDMLSKAGSMGVLNSATSFQSVAPCTGTWRVVKVEGVEHDAAEFVALESFPTLKLADIDEFLDPGQWSKCHPFWCSMTPALPAHPPHRLYEEEVSLACGLGNSLQMKTILEFVTARTAATPTAGARVDMQYWMWKGPFPPQGDGRIVVDEGWISAWDSPNGLQMQTLKIVAFAAPFPGAFLAMIMCPLGYASQGEQMVYNCATQPNVNGGALTIDHSNDVHLMARLVRDGADSAPPISIIRQRVGGGTGGAGFGGAGASGTATSQQGSTASSASSASSASAASAAADSLCGCAKDMAAGYAASYDRMVAGTYQPDDAVRDGVSWWTRLVRDVGLVANAARQGGRRPSGPTPDPGPDPGPAHAPDPGATE